MRGYAIGFARAGCTATAIEQDAVLDLGAGAGGKAALNARARFGALWAKVPVSFVTDDTSELRPEAVFGRAPGDARRIKFLLLTTT